MTNARAKKRASRTSIFLTALAVTALCGAIEGTEPLEDLWRGGRNAVNQRPADGKIAVIGLDDHTLARTTLDFSESFDARVIENLAQAGVKHIYYDRSFHDINDAPGSAELVETLKRHPGLVTLGVIRSPDKFNNRVTNLGPNPIYEPYVKLASLNGELTPFGLSAEFKFSDIYKGRLISTISADVAGKYASTDAIYRPDWRIRAATVPTRSFIDIYDHKSATHGLNGKIVIVGPNSPRIPDTRQVLGQGWVPGVFFHVIGAQTLTEGSPRRISWLFPFAAAIILAGATLKAKTRGRANKLYLTALSATVFVPFITDHYFLTIDYLPAVLLYAIVAYRSHQLKAITTAETHDAISQLPNMVAFARQQEIDHHLVAAMMIKNYHQILAAYPDISQSDLLNALSRPIAVTSNGDLVHHTGNTLFWLLPDVPPDQLADHIDGLSNLLSTVRIGKATIDIDFAIGIDTFVDDAAETRITAAKVAAEQAAAANTTYVLAQGRQQDDDKWRLSLMSELDDAIAADTLAVVYQPQLDIKSNLIIGAEALIRWNHPTRGPIPPADFVAQAESTNRIDRLSRYVFAKALRETRHIIAAHPEVAIGVNISAKLLSKAGLADTLAALLEHYQFPPQNIKLEITETAALASDRAAKTNLERLSAMGAVISIDDYGTGNATLEYLRTIPFDELKLDKQFITDLANSSRDQVLVRSTIALAHTLKRKITAEGIEDERTLKILKSLNCDRAQGFYISRPIGVDALTALFERERDTIARQEKF